MKILYISLFIMSGLVVVVTSHHFFYLTLIKFLNISDNKIKVIIGSLLFVLFMSFLLASALVHWLENDFSRSLYLFSGAWLGVFTNLLVVSLALWLVFLIAKTLGVAINFKIVTIIFVTFAFLVSCFGVWNAQKVVVKEIEVSIKNLPLAWQDKVLVQISDVHLGVVHRPEFIKKVVEQINLQKPQAVFITGDYFDGMDGILDNLVVPLNNLDAPRGVYFITGNHETYLGVEKVARALKSTKVEIIDDKKVDLAGLSLVGIGYPQVGENKNIVEVINKLKPTQPTILLYHIPKMVEEVKNVGIDLMLSGHTHKGQIWPFSYITKIIFGKYYYGLNQEGDFTQYTTSGVGTWGPLMRTGNSPEIVKIILKKKE